MDKILIVFGTRPEAIKMAPIINLMSEKNINHKICVTAQHRQMLDQILNIFGIKPDIDLNLMIDNQTLPDLSSKILKSFQSVIDTVKPDLILVQGDTTTTFVVALSAFYNKVPVGHVEAGLRTFNRMSPYPEEINRTLTSRLADFHFAPTEQGLEYLNRENIKENVFVTGNTVIDAMFLALKKINSKGEINKKRILITCHRRENFGNKMINIFEALKSIAQNHPEFELIYPVHLNPNVQVPAKKILGGVENIKLLAPMEYLEFLSLMQSSYLILTDSGGIQEEAPSLGKPVLVLREDTERPEGIEAGTAKLVGTNPQKIISQVESLIHNEDEYMNMSKATNPYGDGKAAARILNILMDHFNL